MEEETKVIQPEAKEAWSQQRLGRGKEDPFLEAFRESGSCLHLDVRLLASNCERINFCCFKPRNLCNFFVAVTGNQHTWYW
jgi:hypothetical protein